MGLTWGSARVSQYELIREGDASLAAGDAEGAVRHYTAALDLAPEYWLGYHKRAKAHDTLGHREMAIADVTAAIALQDSLICRQLRARLLRQDGDEEGAAADEEVYKRKKSGLKQKTTEKSEEEQHWQEVEERQNRLQGQLPGNSKFAKAMRERAHRMKQREIRLSRIKLPPSPADVDHGRVQWGTPSPVDEERVRLKRASV
eukprot:TRINITY_DN18591_c0_g1_i1.p2 TRINITY_DN18591_c0_g1~~TRINITY_DN18591_c0_g1_i1.p2  ORF type:complete len:202 (+),score=61.92 TRINITY_DN18591_c0_g1_i1:89-694(+)